MNEPDVDRRERFTGPADEIEIGLLSAESPLDDCACTSGVERKKGQEVRRGFRVTCPDKLNEFGIVFEHRFDDMVGHELSQPVAGIRKCL
ncbi:hypothetical protein DM806_17845 [Sphingobium lactosutens]|nr:hypothetical protein [Sphingobium lactosutens]